MKYCWCWLVGLCLYLPLAKAQDRDPLEIKVKSLLDDLTQIGERGYALLPLETSLIKLKRDLTTLGVYLDIPVWFLEEELDDVMLDEIVEEMVSPLSDFDIEQLLLLARDRSGAFIQLYRFLEPVEAIDAPPLTQNSDPFLLQEGKLSKTRPNLDHPAQPRGMLSDKTVWLSAGHGWQYHPRFRTFHTQRHNSYGVVEDFASIEFVNYHLLKYLYQAGANVWTVRERDMNTTEIIIDNDDGYPHYREEGSWHTSYSKGYRGKSYRYTMSGGKSSSKAIYQTLVPKSGRYWVSVRYLSGLNRTVDARYRIHHPGGISEASVNQEVHGDTWVYLGQFYFEGGELARIELVNDSNERGQAVIADAVRLGGGMGTVPDCKSGRVSGEPRFEEGAKYFAAFQGFPKCFNDVVVRPQYAEWELAKGNAQEKRNAIYLSIHTNGSGSSGTESYIHSFRPTRGSKSLQQAVHTELIKDIRSGWNARWPNRGQKSADFGELRGLRTMPGVLLELGFHDHPQDAVALTTPEFRDLAARAIYKGVVKYFAKKEGDRPVYLPETPNALVATNGEGGEIKLSWRAGPYGGYYGSRAEQFKVYLSRHGRAFSDFVVTGQSQYKFRNLEPNTTYFFRVSAVNRGGESFPTQTVAVRTPDPAKASVQYLLVDGFDRLDRSQAHMVYEAKPSFAPLGKVRRLPIEQMNDYSYATEHAEALAAAGIYFDGLDNDALAGRGDIKLERYDGVNWFLGRESVDDEALSFSERRLLSGYLDQGGKLIISGTELGYHLSHKNGDRLFYRRYLKADFRGDDAGSTSVVGNNNSVFRGLNGHIRNVSYAAYPAHSPDYFLPADGGEALFKYRNGKTAAVGYHGDFGLLHFAFPLEMIADKKLRNQLLLKSLEYLHPPRIKDRIEPVRGEVVEN